ncbi:MAG: NUDIX hydrolase [Minisyncoccia bacterium]
MLEKFYQPMGKEIPREEWGLILNNSSWNAPESNVVAHVILNEDNRFALVINRKDEREGGRRRGGGIPTKEVLNGETPIEAARRAVKEELSISGDLQISEEPILVRLNGRNVTHVTFIGKMKFPGYNFKKIEGGGEIKEALFIDPFKTILIRRKNLGYKKGEKDRFEYDPILRGRIVYKSHLGIIAFFIRMKKSQP